MIEENNASIRRIELSAKVVPCTGEPVHVGEESADSVVGGEGSQFGGDHGFDLRRSREGPRRGFIWDCLVFGDILLRFLKV